MRTALIATLAATAAGVMLSGCGSAPVAQTVASPTTSASTACTTPQPLLDICVGRAATAEEETAMLAVGRAGAEADLKLADWSTCSAGQNCFKVSSPSKAIVGTNAGAFDASFGQYPVGGLGAFCVVFVFNDAAGWHYLNVSCAQNPGYMPGAIDHVSIASGCANVRTSPSLAANSIACLDDYTQVVVDSAPVYADGHMWWHLAGRGWMVHDFLARPSYA